MTQLALSRVHFPVSTLGPGSRLAVWFQGCSIRCPGCVSTDTWAPGRAMTTVPEVLDKVATTLTMADGVTITGGEPFDQPDALGALLRGIRALTRADILVFSGYPLEELGPRLEVLGGLIDCLVSDPFERDTPQTLALRGSDNQRLRYLTPLGRQRFEAFDRPLHPSDRALDVVFDHETSEAFLVGIPRPGDMLRLAGILAGDRHEAVTTEDKRQSR